MQAEISKREQDLLSAQVSHTFSIYILKNIIFLINSRI